jgi:hypothetical protein
MSRRLVTIGMIALFIVSGYSLFLKRLVRHFVRRPSGRSRRAQLPAREVIADELARMLWFRRGAYLDLGFHLVTFLGSAIYLLIELTRRRLKSG